MAVHHQPHLLDFSTPPPAFDNNGLLTLHPVAGGDMSATSGGGVLITGDTTPPPWPQAAVSPLSLQFNYNHHRQPFTAAAPPAVALSVAPHHELQVPAAAGSLQQPFHLILRSSKYLGPVKELLGEFCSLEVEGEFHATADKRDSRKAAAGNKWDDAEAAVSSSWLWGSPSSISSMGLFEFERRKARLMSMVQEVDRRYRRYREQMRSVELSFEAVTGAGAAQVYTRLARRAMSRHFRCLRDALVAQVRALKKAMGDRDGGVAPAGATKGDTPRLRVLDQCLRQRRAFQQPAGATESCPWRPQRGLPKRAVAVLRAWLFEHFLHPYPNDVDKHILSRQTGLSRSQVSNWFINARVRLWKPMIEDMYKEEMNLQQNPSDDTAAAIVKAERCTATMDLGGGGGGGSYQHQQQPFIASPMMQHQQSSAGRLLMLEEEDQLPESVLPYTNLMGSQASLHDLAG